MATLTIKNIPDALYKELKEQAASHHRSLNSEVIVSLEQAIRGSRLDIQSILKSARTIREKTSKYKLTSKKLTTIKNQGRP